jgi:tetratricopeptide (TPR) repeat protein
MPEKKRDGGDLLPLPDTRELFLMAGLEEAERHIKRKHWAQALPVLEALDDAYPDNFEVLAVLGMVLFELQDFDNYLGVCEQLRDLMPDDADATMALAEAYMLAIHPAHALDTLRQFMDRHPRHEQIGDVAKMRADLEDTIKELLAPLGLEGQEGFEIGLLHEKLQTLTEEGDYKEAHKVAEKLLRRKPDFVPALNNLSQVYAIEGRLDQAVATAERVLAQQPDNVHALSNLTRFLCLLGRLDEAVQYGEQLKAMESDTPDRWLKQAEALSYLGDDEGVLAAFQGAQRAGLLKPPFEEPLLYHLAAVATLRQGREAEARRYWQRAQKIAPSFELVEGNLADLHQPVSERHAPWPFNLRYWLTEQAVQDLQGLIRAVAGHEEDPAAMAQATERYLHKHPEVASLIPLLFDRGDPMGRTFALNIAMTAQTPDMLVALRDFALSRRGPDALRMQAAQVVSDAGLFPPGLVTLWADGEWRDLLLMGFDIHNEPTVEHGPEVERVGGEAVEALHRKDGDEAERLLREALALEPDAPDLLNNLAIAYEQQGRSEEAEALLHQIHAQHPDYAFSTLSLVRLALRRGDIPEAKELLDTLGTQRRFHVSELAAFCDAQIELALAEDRPEAARSWLEMWEQVTPDHPALLVRHLQLGPAPRRAAPRPPIPKRPTAKPKKPSKSKRRY